jgi:hypothetical protein
MHGGASSSSPAAARAAFLRGGGGAIGVKAAVGGKEDNRGLVDHQTAGGVRWPGAMYPLHAGWGGGSAQRSVVTDPEYERLQDENNHQLLMAAAIPAHRHPSVGTAWQQLTAAAGPMYCGQPQLVFPSAKAGGTVVKKRKMSAVGQAQPHFPAAHQQYGQQLRYSGYGDQPAANFAASQVTSARMPGAKAVTGGYSSAHDRESDLPDTVPQSTESQTKDWTNVPTQNGAKNYGFSATCRGCAGSRKAHTCGKARVKNKASVTFTESGPLGLSFQKDGKNPAAMMLSDVDLTTQARSHPCLLRFVGCSTLHSINRSESVVDYDSGMALLRKIKPEHRPLILTFVRTQQKKTRRMKKSRTSNQRVPPKPPASASATEVPAGIPTPTQEKTMPESEVSLNQQAQPRNGVTSGSQGVAVSGAQTRTSARYLLWRGDGTEEEAAAPGLYHAHMCDRAAAAAAALELPPLGESQDFQSVMSEDATMKKHKICAADRAQLRFLAAHEQHVQPHASRLLGTGGSCEASAEREWDSLRYSLTGSCEADAAVGGLLAHIAANGQQPHYFGYGSRPLAVSCASAPEQQSVVPVSQATTAQVPERTRAGDMPPQFSHAAQSFLQQCRHRFCSQPEKLMEINQLLINRCNDATWAYREDNPQFDDLLEGVRKQARKLFNSHPDLQEVFEAKFVACDESDWTIRNVMALIIDEVERQRYTEARGKHHTHLTAVTSPHRSSRVEFTDMAKVNVLVDRGTWYGASRAQAPASKDSKPPHESLSSVSTAPTIRAACTSLNKRDRVLREPDWVEGRWTLYDGSPWLGVDHLVAQL